MKKLSLCIVIVLLFTFFSPVKAHSSTHGDFFTELIVEIWSVLWAINNLSVEFGDYPYATDMDYIRFNPNATGLYNAKNYRGVFNAGALFMSFPTKTEISYGVQTSFKAYIYKFFGPDAEIYTLSKNFSLNNAVLGSRLGLRFSTFQFKYICMATYWQWIHWALAENQNGFVFGIDYEIYPVKPIIIRGRVGFVFLKDDTFVEFDNTLGFIVNRYEVYVGHRAWLNAQEPHINSKDLSGLTAGMRIYF